LEVANHPSINVGINTVLDWGDQARSYFENANLNLSNEPNHEELIAQLVSAQKEINACKQQVF
jgi:hypothetical protein